MRIRIAILAALCASQALAQGVRWAATTGNTSVTSNTTATVQQPATGAQIVQLEQVVVYCSAACTVAQYANGTAATATTGTITPILPALLSAPISATFWTASNVGTGTLQGGIYNQTAAGTVGFCLNTSCGASQSVSLAMSGTGSNYSVVVTMASGTANVTFYGRSY